MKNQVNRDKKYKKPDIWKENKYEIRVFNQEDV